MLVPVDITPCLFFSGAHHLTIGSIDSNLYLIFTHASGRKIYLSILMLSFMAYPTLNY